MLTVAQLQAIPACAPAIAAFEARWPEGRAPLRAVVLALADHPRGWGWWEWLASQLPALRPAWEEYEATERTAWKAYKAIECPAWVVEHLAKEDYDRALRQAIRDAAALIPEEANPNA